MNKKYLSILCILGMTVLLSACSSTPSRNVVTNTKDVPKLIFESETNKGQYIAELAQSMIGTAYVYGGHSPQQGFDCSGLVFYTHTQVGEQVPRVSFAQLSHSKPVPLDKLQAGDLLFYNINGKPSHVGIYIGDDKFIHAPSSGKKVSVTSIDNPYFKPRLIRAGRLYQ